MSSSSLFNRKYNVFAPSKFSAEMKNPFHTEDNGEPLVSSSLKVFNIFNEDGYDGYDNSFEVYEIIKEYKSESNMQDIDYLKLLVNSLEIKCKYPENDNVIARDIISLSNYATYIDMMKLAGRDINRIQESFLKKASMEKEEGLSFVEYILSPYIDDSLDDEVIAQEDEYDNEVEPDFNNVENQEQSVSQQEAEKQNSSENNKKEDPVIQENEGSFEQSHEQQFEHHDDQHHDQAFEQHHDQQAFDQHHDQAFEQHHDQQAFDQHHDQAFDQHHDQQAFGQHQNQSFEDNHDQQGFDQHYGQQDFDESSYDDQMNQQQAYFEDSNYQENIQNNYPHEEQSNYDDISSANMINNQVEQLMESTVVVHLGENLSLKELTQKVSDYASKKSSGNDIIFESIYEQGMHKISDRLKNKNLTDLSEKFLMYGNVKSLSLEDAKEKGRTAINEMNSEMVS